MLSKVLSARDAARAQPVVFAPAAVGYPAAPRATAAPPNDAETAALRQRIRQLEAELAMARQERFEAGQREGRAETAPVIERLNASIAELAGMRPSLRRGAEKDVVQLALLVARRVLHRELSVDENALTALVRMAFDRLSRAESCRITVNPRFAPSISAGLPAAQLTRLRIEPDPNCALGTVILQSDEGVIDASVDAQLDEINRGLTDRLQER